MSEVFFTLEDVREKLARWQADYNCTRPHSALQDQAPASFAADCRRPLRPSANPCIAGDTHVSYARFATPHGWPQSTTQEANSRDLVRPTFAGKVYRWKLSLALAQNWGTDQWRSGLSFTQD